MTKLAMSITYPHKIEPVKDGRCTQTIRKGRKVAEGDEILFHGWSGGPYRSKWDWRKRVVVSEIIDIIITENGVVWWDKDIYNRYIWSDPECDKIAKMDFIDPPTGESLRDVLFGLNGAPDCPEEYQIIRW